MNRDLCGVEPRARGHTNAGHKERERARANHIRRVLHCARGWSVGCVRLRKAEVTEGAMSRLHSLCSFGDEHASCSDRSLTVNPLRFRPPLRFLRPTDGDNGAVGAWANLCRKCPSSVERRFRRQFSTICTEWTRESCANIFGKRDPVPKVILFFLRVGVIL